MILGLIDEETAALARLLRNNIDDDRYPLSARIKLLKGNSREDPARTPSYHT